MDATGVVFRQPLRIFSSFSYPSCVNSTTFSTYVPVKQRRRAVGILSSRFFDQGYVKYYNSNSAPSAGMTMEANIGKKEKTAEAMKMKKKQLELLKGLLRDLSAFSQMNLGSDLDSTLLDQVKGNRISEASEILLQQLQMLKAEKKELKKKKKEAKARLRSSHAQNSALNACKTSYSSSSESSSSSDVECVEVIDVSSLSTSQSSQNTSPQAIDQASESVIPILPTMAMPAELTAAEASNLGEEDLVFEKKIEVCMGGKCKKSGAGALLEEFERVVGAHGAAAVAGCKCMGKCRNGPNVKISDANSLHMGVGLQDVHMIVGNLHSGNCDLNQLGFAAC